MFHIRVLHRSCLCFILFAVLIFSTHHMAHAVSQIQMKSEWGQMIQDELQAIVRINKYPDFAGASSGAKTGWQQGAKAGRALGEWAGGSALGTITEGVLGAGGASIGEKVGAANAHSPDQVRDFLDKEHAILHKSQYQLSRLRKIAGLAGDNSKVFIKEIDNIESELKDLIEFVDARYPMSTHPLAFKEIVETMNGLTDKTTVIVNKVDSVSCSINQ